MRTLFLAWEDPENNGWYPVGRLTFDGTIYQFVYTRGATRANTESGFEELESFPDLRECYESEEIFPLFANRVPQRSREDYADYVKWLNVPKDEDDPVGLLTRSGGKRATDTFEVFPCPQADEDGNFHIHLFAHGLRYLPQQSIDRIEKLSPGEELLLALDFQNAHDPSALMLRTGGLTDGDRHIVGYCPRYLLSDIYNILDDCGAQIKVEQLNLPPAPLQFRLMCSMTGCWPDGFRPCSSDDYQPIIADPALTDTPD